MSVPTFELAPGYRISRLIKGGWQLAGGHGAVDRQRAVDDMFRFVDAGFTTFDCADIYTGVEALIGDFLEQYRATGRSADVPVRVHTKFVPDLDTLETIGPRDVTRIIDRSLRRLGVDVLDLVQFGWWRYEVPRFVEVSGWLSDLQRAGKIRHLGATNFDVPRLRTMIDAGVRFVSHQVQYSVLDHRPERGMVTLCRQHGIKLLCYGAVAGGFLRAASLGAPEPHPPFENRSLTKYHLIIEEFGGWDAFQRLLETLTVVGRRHGVSAAAVAVRYVLDKPEVAGVIVGARDAGHVEDLLAAASLTLDADDRHRLAEARTGAPGPAGDVYDLERVPDGRHAVIMKYNLNRAAAD